MATSKKMTSAQRKDFVEFLQVRFEDNMQRHKNLKWTEVSSKLTEKNLQVLHQMEMSGGEPDVVGKEKKTGSILFFDCSVESPKERRSLCYDRAAWDSRKANKPKGNAMDLAKTMGISMLSEEQYRYLQTLGEFDLKTSSWILTPSRIRKLGGALFCDRRFDAVFTYHNGAESYYAARGFRGYIAI